MRKRIFHSRDSHESQALEGLCLTIQDAIMHIVSKKIFFIIYSE